MRIRWSAFGRSDLSWPLPLLFRNLRFYSTVTGAVASLTTNQSWAVSQHKIYFRARDANTSMIKNCTNFTSQNESITKQLVTLNVQQKYQQNLMPCVKKTSSTSASNKEKKRKEGGGAKERKWASYKKKNPPFTIVVIVGAPLKGNLSINDNKRFTYSWISFAFLARQRVKCGDSLCK